MIGLRRMMMAGGGSAPSAHRYWRINVSANSGSTQYTGFTEIEFRGSVGGPDLIPVQSSNGPASASTRVNDSNAAWMAADNRMTHGWLSNTSAASWWRYDFGHPLNTGPTVANVRQVAIYGSYNAPNASPKDFTIEWSDDGVAWTVALAVTGQTGWTGASDVRVFDIP